LTAAAYGRAPKSNWADFEGSRIHFYDIGNSKNRKALVFIHGWTCNADFWKDSYSSFPSYRIIALDLIGHGESDKPKTSYSMDYFAQAVDAVMKKAKVQQAVLVGHSMGTPVARQFYRLYPERTLAIIAVDGALAAMGSKAEMEAVFAPIRTNFKENAPKFVDEMLKPIKDARLRATSDRIGVPVLAIMAASPWWAPDTRERFNAVATQFEFQMWTGVSHFLMMEQPSRFNTQLRNFIVRNKLL
jgi:pimeloyl-ACP methyl ester carboxylesterase